VRHHLVQRIIRAYDEHKNRVAESQMSLLESRGTGNGSSVDTGLRVRVVAPPPEADAKE